MQHPTHSPWGEIQQCAVLCPGAYSVSTAGHGGVMLEKEIAASLSEEAQKIGFLSGSYLCFEEDCDAPVALRELMDRQLYTPTVNERYAPGQYEKQINDSLQTWHKEYWQTRQTRITQQSLPEYCYSCLSSTGEIVILKRGEPGYYKTDIPVSDHETAKELVKFYNDRLGVTKPQYRPQPHPRRKGTHHRYGVCDS